MNAYAQVSRKIRMTAAEQFWYVLGCVAFGAAYLQKVPVKKALSDYGLVEMTAAESFWYVLGCVAFGAAYFMKIPVAKALSELPQYQDASSREQLRLSPTPSTPSPEIGQAVPGQSSATPEEQREQESSGN